MRLIVKTWTERTIALDVEAAASIDDVKAQIEQTMHLSCDQQSLFLDSTEDIFGCNGLLDGCTLFDYNIQDGDVLKCLRRRVDRNIVNFDNGHERQLGIVGQMRLGGSARSLKAPIEEYQYQGLVDVYLTFPRQYLVVKNRLHEKSITPEEAITCFAEISARKAEIVTQMKRMQSRRSAPGQLGSLETERKQTEDPDEEGIDKPTPLCDATLPGLSVTSHRRVELCCAIVCSAAAGAFFGCLPPVMVKAYKGGVTPITYTLCRAAAAIVTFLIVQFASACYQKIMGRARDGFGSTLPVTTAGSTSNCRFWPDRSLHLKIGCLLGLSSALYASFSLSYFMSMKYLPVSTACLFFYTYPIVVLMLHIFSVESDKQPGKCFIALHIVAFFGLLLSLGPELTLGVSCIGAALGCSASTCFAGYLSCAACLTQLEVPAIVVALFVNVGQVGILGVLTGLGAVGGDAAGGMFPWRLPSVSEPDVVLAFTSGILGYVAAQALLSMALAIVKEAPLVAFFLNIEPIVSISLAVFVLGEHMSWLRWFGVVILVAALSSGPFVSKTSERVRSNQHL